MRGLLIFAHLRPPAGHRRYSDTMWRLAALIVALFLAFAVYEAAAGNWLSFR